MKLRKKSEVWSSMKGLSKCLKFNGIIFRLMGDEGEEVAFGFVVDILLSAYREYSDGLKVSGQDPEVTMDWLNKNAHLYIKAMLGNGDDAEYELCEWVKRQNPGMDDDSIDDEPPRF